MLTVQLVLFGTPALLAVVFGIRYLVTREFMPYHATVAGRSWGQLEPGVQTIILGMLRIVGGGLVTTGVATAWLMLALYQHVPWAPWALLSVTLTGTLPSLFVTIWLRRVQPAARTPVLPAGVAFAVGALGVALSLFP